MKLSITAITLLIWLFTSCKTRDSNHLFSYKQTPKFIKSYLDSISNGDFAIAERGQSWNSSCVREKEDKKCQFISADFDSVKYQLDFWAGGFIGKHRRKIVILFKNKSVSKFTDEYVK